MIGIDTNTGIGWGKICPVSRTPTLSVQQKSSLSCYNTNHILQGAKAELKQELVLQTDFSDQISHCEAVSSPWLPLVQQSHMGAGVIALLNMAYWRSMKPSQMLSHTQSNPSACGATVPMTIKEMSLVCWSTIQVPMNQWYVSHNCSLLVLDQIKDKYSCKTTLDGNWLGGRLEWPIIQGLSLKILHVPN